VFFDQAAYGSSKVFLDIAIRATAPPARIELVPLRQNRA
jgi:hypothetical protein